MLEDNEQRTFTYPMRAGVVTLALYGANAITRPANSPKTLKRETETKIAVELEYRVINLDGARELLDALAKAISMAERYEARDLGGDDDKQN